MDSVVMVTTRFIGILSGKGGVGKTTLAVNIATALSALGKDSVVIDTDFTTANVGLMLGANSVPSSINSALHGVKNICDVAYVHRSGLKVIPASLSLGDYSPERLAYLQSVLFDLRGNVEYAIFDCASGISKEVDASIRCLDAAIVVTTPDIISVTDALKMITYAEDMGCPVVGVVVNKVKNDRFEMRIDNIVSLLRKPVFGIVPYDDSVREALHIKQPVVFSHPAAVSSNIMVDVAKNLIA
jgi:septum site-determining protein MinD